MGKAEKQQCGIGNAFFRSFLNTCSRSGQEMCQAATGSTWMSRSLVEDGDKWHQVTLGDNLRSLSWEEAEGEGGAVADCENLDLDPAAL